MALCEIKHRPERDAHDRTAVRKTYGNRGRRDSLLRDSWYRDPMGSDVNGDTVSDAFNLSDGLCVFFYSDKMK